MSLLVKALRKLDARPSADPSRTAEATPGSETPTGFEATPSFNEIADAEATAADGATISAAATATIDMPPDLAEPEPLDESAFSPAWTADEWPAAEASPDTIAVLSALLDEMLTSPPRETPEPDESLPAESFVPIGGLPFGDPLPFTPIVAELPAFDLPVAELPIAELPDAGIPAAVSTVEDLTVETVPIAESAAAIEPMDSPLAGPPALDSTIGREYQALSDQLVNDLEYLLPAALMFAPVEAGADDLLLPLAAALAGRQAGRVLIVEAGGNESQWPARLGIDVATGLTDLLKSQSAWREAVRPTMVPRVDLLARGADAWPTSAAVASAAETLLSELKTAYGMVLIAAPEAAGPLAAMLAPACDAAVLVLDLERTPRRLAGRAKRWLELHGVRVIGCVVRAAA